MTSFYKLSGGGNDFLALVEPEEEPTPDAIRAWCARGLSIGADGVFTLARADNGIARMIHYNADGGRAELCVNGTRCAARLAFHLDWAGDSVTIRTDSGDIAASAEADSTVALELPPPDTPPEAVTLELDGEPLAGWRMRVGVPHLVLAWERELDDAPIAELGPRLRRHELFGAEGANIHWVRYADRHRFAIRSFERGVEAETLACGSGVLAAAAVGVATRRLDLPAAARTRGGFVFTVDGRADDDRVMSWNLAGDARLVAHGELL